MATAYTKTDNIGLDLYGDNDPADLRDGYNSSMRKIDSAVKANTDAINLKADKTTTYSKTDVDTKLSAKADTATTYSKTDVDTKLSAKADTATTYSKTDVDTKLSTKADSANTYSKTDVDGAISTITTSVSTINNNIVVINRHLPIFHKGIIVGDSWSYANNETTTDNTRHWVPNTECL